MYLDVESDKNVRLIDFLRGKGGAGFWLETGRSDERRRFIFQVFVRASAGFELPEAGEVC